MTYRALETARLIVELAKRDSLNNVGRVLISDLVSGGYSLEEITAALKILEGVCRVVIVGDYIKVFLGECGSFLQAHNSG